MPTILTFNAGTIADRPYPDQVERTAIGKSPVAGRVRLTRLGLVGDQQEDLSHHGGPDRALCSYVADHHLGWVGALGRVPEPGLFGENLTVQGVDETQVHCGDRFRVGSAIIEVTEKPHTGCVKFTQRFGLAATRWINSRKDLRLRGINAVVVEAGEVAPGDTVRKL